jgi:RHS repeat-associated protein
VYDEGSYTPIGKLVNGERYSIVSDYIGRPIQCFDDKGGIVWETDYDIYGRLKNLRGEKGFIPFRQLGQYEDEEMGSVYYNRFRFYDSQSGVYISQDPVSIEGGFNIYAYVRDSNFWVDLFGLTDFSSWLAKGKSNYSNYMSDVYTGITDNFDRRLVEHGGKNGDLIKLENTGNLTKNQSRCVEQAIIKNVGIEKLNNKINSINPKRDIYNEAVDWGEDWIQKNDKDVAKKLRLSDKITCK